MNTLSTSQVKARKAHQCSLCYEAIKPGDTYTRQTNVDDGNIWTWKTDARCTELVHEWLTHFSDPYTEGVTEGTYREVVGDLCDHYGCTEGELKAKIDEANTAIEAVL